MVSHPVSPGFRDDPYREDRPPSYRVGGFEPSGYGPVTDEPSLRRRKNLPLAARSRRRRPTGQPAQPTVPPEPAQPPPVLHQLVTALVGFVGFAVATLVLRVADGHPIAVWAAIVVTVVVPGCALAAWVPVRDGLSRVLVALAAGLTWSILVSTLLAERRIVTPRTVQLTTGTLGALVCLIYLIFVLMVRRAHLSRLSGMLDPALQRHARAAGDIPERIAGASLVVLAAALWLLSMLLARGHVVRDYGLVPVLGVPFVLAVVIAVGTAVWALVTRHRRTAVAGLSLVVVFLNGTPAALVDHALTSWMYKHFGVVDYIVQGGALNNPRDVYQQWPGFFAAAASVVTLSGVSPMSYSNWAQLAFEALNCLVIFAIGRKLAPNRPAVPYVAVLLFATTAWEGQRYYSPQTVAFLLALLLQYFALFLMNPDGLRLRRFLERRPRGNRAIYAAPSWSATSRPLRGWSAFGVGAGIVAMFAAMTVTHQLSPYIVFLGVGGLWVAGILRRPSLVFLLACILAASSVWHSATISHLPWFTGFQLSNATGVDVGASSDAQALASSLARPIAIGLWLFAALCVLSYRRHVSKVAVPAVLTVAPFFVVVLQSYGGEAIYRVFLFTSPWCAIAIAMRACDVSRLLAARWVVLALWCAGAAIGSAQASGFGQLPLLFVTPGESRASAYFLDHSPDGATLVLGSLNFPSRLNANYVKHNAVDMVNDPALSDVKELRGDALKTVNLRSLARTVDDLANGDGYLAIGPAMLAGEDYYRTTTPGTLNILTQRLRTSKYWRLWYDSDGVVIFEARP